MSNFKESFFKHPLLPSGELFLKDTLVYFEYPRAFSCIGKDDKIFVFLEYYEEKDISKWVGKELTKETYGELLSRKISLRRSILETEGPFYYIEKDFDTDIDTVFISDKLQNEKDVTPYETFVNVQMIIR